MADKDTKWDFDDIKQAVNVLQTTTVKRMDGDDYSCYKAGTIIRIDLKGAKA